MRAVICFVLTALAVAEAHRYGHGRPSQPAAVSAGDPCTPRRVGTCGEEAVMTVSSTPASESSYGPNVCHYEEMYETGTLTYEWQRYCSYWGYCWYSCVSSNQCDGERVNVTRSYTSCCEGYASRSSSQDYDFWLRHHRHHKSFLRTEGCPIKLMGTVLDCLESLNLTEFLSLIQGTPLEDTLSQTDTSFTIFALTNEAVAEIAATLAGFSEEELVEVLSTHIVEDTIPDSKLFHGSTFTPLMNETLLHVTDVYEHAGWGYFRWKISETTFINGAEVVEKDACQALNGIVHVVDSLIPTSTRSIAEILDADADVSTFKELLDVAGISVYLNLSNPRTVVAPTNAAFDEFGVGFSDCLKEEEHRRQLKYLLLIHVIYPVEYTSSLSLRNHVPTFSGFYLKVQDINGTIHLTRDEIPLSESDTPARNGVIHGIDELIVPPCLNLTALCPPSPPAPPLPVLPIVGGGENPEQPLEDLSPDEMPPGVVGDV